MENHYENATKVVNNERKAVKLWNVNVRGTQRIWKADHMHPVLNYNVYGAYEEIEDGEVITNTKGKMTLPSMTCDNAKNDRLTTERITRQTTSSCMLI